jgi:hypothetical protein
LDQVLFQPADGFLQLGFDLLGELLFRKDLGEQRRFPGFEILLEGFAGRDDLEHVDVVEEVVLHRPKEGHLRFHPLRRVGRLLEEFDRARTAIELALGAGIEVGPELREGRQLAVGRQFELHFPGHLLGRLDLGRGTHPRNRKADRDRRADALVERSVSRKICPSVIEMTLVGM